MLRRNIMNQLLNQYGLTYTGSTEQSDLTTLLIWAEQIYDLDTGLQHLLRRCLLLEGWCRSVDWPVLFRLRRLDLIDWITQYIEQSSQGVLTNRDRNRRSCGDGIHSADKSVGWS